MRIITLNVNGIRSCHKKGFFDWVATTHADIICLQEIRATKEILAHSNFALAGMQSAFSPAEKSGYSGVAIYSKSTPQQIISKLTPLAATEGRYIEAVLQDLHVVSIYFPSGTSGAERQKIKIEFLHNIKDFLIQIVKNNKKFILCGDFNIAHKNIDLKNWKNNQKNSGFLPEERAFLDWMLDELGFIDAFRAKNQHPEQYTWWSTRGKAYEKNVGWRIDYQMLSPALANTIQEVTIFKELRFSDHAPVIIDYTL